jgi:hypothetical protein
VLFRDYYSPVAKPKSKLELTDVSLLPLGENCPKNLSIEPPNLVGTRSTASLYFQSGLGRGGARHYQIWMWFYMEGDDGQRSNLARPLSASTRWR